MKQEAQLPLREQGVSVALSFYHNTILTELGFLSLVVPYVCDFSSTCQAPHSIRIVVD